MGGGFPYWTVSDLGQFFYRVYPAGEEGRGIVLTRVSTGIKQMYIPSIDFVFGISGFFFSVSGNPAF